MATAKRIVTVVLATSVLVTLVGGCVWRGAPAPSDTRDLSGTWYGDIVQPGGSLYTVEAQSVLEIKADGTFTATVTPMPGANNLARRSSWSGVVVGSGTRVTFRTAQGPWLMLVRSRHHLYGIANDPTTAMDVMIDFERAHGQ